MNILRRALLLVSLGTLFVSVILLLNFTAPNPTHRRYSSEMPAETAPRDDGGAERILSLDLGVPQNTITSPRQCICNPNQTSSLPNLTCDVCAVIDASVGSANIPDFVTDSYIAEAKNYAPNSDIYRSNRQQLDAFRAMANYLHRPLWLYVAVDSSVSPELQSLMEQTGGGVVFYFTVSGYVDPVDEGARKVAFGSAFILGVFALSEIPSRRRSTPKTPHDTAHRAHESADTVEDFAKRSKERFQIPIDIDDE